MPQAALSWPAWYGVLVFTFVATIAWLAAFDVRTRRIPNRVVYPAIGVASVTALVNPTGPWYWFAVGGLVGAGLLGVIALVAPDGMGMGDVKLAGLIGLIAGWPGVLVALFVAFAAGAVAGIALVAAHRLERGSAVPFAPALFLGTVTALVAGQNLVALVLGGARP
jgi:prepilin signal peptidase PulO-like enzyme (type II secretory pathway)